MRRARGDIRLALESFAQSRAICERLIRETPGDGELLKVAGELYSETTVARFELGDLAEAAESAASAMDMARRLLALSPGDRVHRQGFATANVSLGTVRIAAGQLESAVASYRAAIEIREQLVKEEPNNVSYRRRLRRRHRKVVILLRARAGAVPQVDPVFPHDPRVEFHDLAAHGNGGILQ